MIIDLPRLPSLELHAAALVWIQDDPAELELVELSKALSFAAVMDLIADDLDELAELVAQERRDRARAQA